LSPAQLRSGAPWDAVDLKSTRSPYQTSESQHTQRRSRCQGWSGPMPIPPLHGATIGCVPLRGVKSQRLHRCACNHIGITPRPPHVVCFPETICVQRVIDPERVVSWAELNGGIYEEASSDLWPDGLSGFCAAVGGIRPGRSVLLPQGMWLTFQR